MRRCMAMFAYDRGVTPYAEPLFDIARDNVQMILRDSVTTEQLR